MKHPELVLLPLLVPSFGLSASIPLPVSAPSFAIPREEAWLGCWGSPDGPAILLEPERCVWLREEQARCYRLRRGEQGVQLESWGRLTPLVLEVEGDELVLEGGGVSARLPRLESVPSSLRIDPYPLPETFEIDADTAAALGEELAERSREDQRVRQAARGESFDEKQRRAMIEVDRDNTDFLLSILEEMGWIDAVRFGPQASQDAFLLVQHSDDLRLMRTALPHVEKDVRAGRIDGQSYALLYDRLQLNLGYLQRYGSQLATTADDESVLMPCEDPEKVNERRAELGMEPLESYLSWFQTDPEQPIRTLEEALAEVGK